MISARRDRIAWVFAQQYWGRGIFVSIGGTKSIARFLLRRVRIKKDVLT
jgi:hypothetical protein